MSRRLAQLDRLPVTELKGVGEARAGALAALGVHTVLDLLTYYPRRYIDRTNQARIGELDVGEEATVLVEVLRVSGRRTRTRKSLVTADVTDGTAHLRVTFFNQPFRERQLKPGTQVVLFGRLEVFQGRRQMTNPVVDLVGDRTGRIVPVYPQSEKAGVMSWDVARFVEEVLARAGDFAEPLDAGLRARHDLVDRTTAFRDIHAPESMRAAADARRRLVFDELLRVQLELVRRKRELERTAVGIAHEVGPDGRGGPLVSRFHERLPYALTGAQQRVLGEIFADLAAPRPMHRLLQGDVGAGKTVVAVSALLAAVQGGHQGALMAPTEVLAEQHHLGIRALLDGFTVPDTDEASLFGGAGLDRPLQGRAAHQQDPGGGAAPHPRRPRRRGRRPRHRHPRAHLRGHRVPVPGGGGDRRAAPLRRRAARRAAGQEQHRGGARRPGDDRHPDPAHRGDDRVRRPRRLGARRAATGPHPDHHPLGPRGARRGRGVGAGSRRGRRRAPGLRGLPADRRERQARGPVGRGDPRPAHRRRALGPAGRAAARAARPPPTRTR